MRCQGLQRDLSGFISRAIEYTIDFVLETIESVLAGLRLQFAIVCDVCNLTHFTFLLIYLLSDLVHNVLLCDNILNSNCEACVY